MKAFEHLKEVNESTKRARDENLKKNIFVNYKSKFNFVQKFKEKTPLQHFLKLKKKSISCKSNAKGNKTKEKGF